MITMQDIAMSFARTAGMIQKFADGISHEESLLQLPYDANCMNWVIGHMVNSRNSVIRLSGAPDRQWQQLRTWEELRARYGNGSPAIKQDGPEVLKFENILEGLRVTQTAIEDVLCALSPAQAAREIEFAGRKQTVEQMALYMWGHEQYHTGQLECLRPLTGRKNP